MHARDPLAPRERGARALWGALVLALSLCGPLAVSAAHAQALPDFTELVEKVGPAVVNIRTVERLPVNAGGSQEMDPDLLDLFRRFGVPVPQHPQVPPGERPLQRGVGSGFILNADGYVMTNAHVVEDADEVMVTLTDRREFKAKIVGVDERTDVALVKIEATSLPFVHIGDVSRLKVGEWVIAIGSPFDLENTVTAGIVSAKARETGEYLPFIQTDVAINPGNSGGPLINMRGEVIGINSQIYSRSGGFMGISFAIPIDEASRVAQQLQSNGRVVRGRIGVVIDRVGREVAEAIGLGRPVGAFVRSVQADGPAEHAGVEAGDIITRFDDHAIERSGDLPRVVGNTKPGTHSSMQVFRRGKYVDLGVTVAELQPDEPHAANEPKSTKPPVAVGSLGLAVGELDAAQRGKQKEKAGGVRVVNAEGRAARAGLREGDVILALGNTQVASVQDFNAAAAQVDKSLPVSVLVRRGDVVQFVVIKPGA